MTLFAITCLFIIMISIQHLLNWGWRSVFKSESNNDMIGGLLMVTFVGVIFTFYCMKYLVIWLCPLIN